MRYENLLHKKNGSETPDNATAQSIVTAAQELFLERGFKAVTMREIAAHANVNLGLLPYYFKTKDNLANHVYTKITDEMYQMLSAKYHLDELSNAVRMYVYTVLTFEEADIHFNRFYYEYLETCHGNEVNSSTFINMSRQVIQDYGVHVSHAENEVYLLALKGAERLLHLKRNHHEINISTRKIFNLILSNYFYNIGLTDRQIAEIIEESNDVLNHLPNTSD